MVRIFADPRHPPYAAEIQAALLRLVRGLVPVPAVLETRPAVPEAGMPGLLVTELVPGVRADLLLPDLDEAAQRTLGAALGRVAGTLARIPMLRAGTFADADLRIEPFDLWLPDWVDAHAEALGWEEPDLHGLRSVAEVAADRLEAWALPRLVHSDLNPKNVLVDPDTLQVTAVVDWEFAHAGHPATDLGNLVRFDRAPAYVGGVLAGWRELQQGTELPDDPVLLDLARSADLVALVELASRRAANPVAARAHDQLLIIARSGDVHALA